MSKARLLKEVQNVKKLDCVENVELDNDDILSWIVRITGPEGTPYEGFTLIVQIKYPETYPNEKPTVSFNPIIYHCNVKSTGEMCLTVLNEWKPTNTASDIITHVRQRLLQPDPLVALDEVKGKLLETDPQAYFDEAKADTEQNFK